MEIKTAMVPEFLDLQVNAMCSLSLLLFMGNAIEEPRFVFVSKDFFLFSFLFVSKDFFYLVLFLFLKIFFIFVLCT